MSIDLFWYGHDYYPEWEKSGFSARFAFPFAKEVCKGVGYDVGCGKEEWAFPGAMAVDPAIPDSMNRFNREVDYIFSSHCLEHLPDWVAGLEAWSKLLRPGGVLFLYLPDYSSEYWRPWVNRKHHHALNRIMIKDWMKANGFHKILSAGPDLNHSFIVMGEKQ